MKTLKLFVSAFVIGSFIMSCGNASENKPTEQTEVSSNEAHQHDDGSETIKLNNGEKWAVNEEMKPFILDAEGILNQYTTRQSENYKILASQLKEKNGGLIKSCTMKGESHDELHKWLHPHMELIESLSKAESTDEANEIIAALQVSFASYNQYFQ